MQEMEAAAQRFTSLTPGWSSNLGLFFHVYGHASVNALHLHVVDLDATGPSFEALSHKNLPLQAAPQPLHSMAFSAAAHRPPPIAPTLDAATSIHHPPTAHYPPPAVHQCPLNTLAFSCPFYAQAVLGALRAELQEARALDVRTTRSAPPEGCTVEDQGYISDPEVLLLSERLPRLPPPRQADVSPNRIGGVAPRMNPSQARGCPAFPWDKWLKLNLPSWCVDR